MTVVAKFSLGVAICLCLACQRGQTTAPSAVANTASPAPAADAALPAPPLAQPAALSQRVQVELPKAPTGRVRRTRRPFTAKELAWLSSFEFNDFTRDDGGTSDEAIEVRHTTKTRPKLGVTVRIDSCPTDARVGGHGGRAQRIEEQRPVAADLRACLPMQLPLWQAQRDELKQFLTRDLAIRSDTLFNIGVHELAGVTAIATYQLGHLFALDDHNQTVALSSTAYALYYNDGVNRIRVMASYLDDAVPTRGQLRELAPPRELAKMAAAFMSFYLHQWR